MVRKRILSIVLTLAMVVGMIPAFYTTASAGVVGTIASGIAGKLTSI